MIQACQRGFTIIAALSSLASVVRHELKRPDDYRQPCLAPRGLDLAGHPGPEVLPRGG